MKLTALRLHNVKRFAGRGAVGASFVKTKTSA